MDVTGAGGDFYKLSVRAPGHIGVGIGDTCGRGGEGQSLLSRIMPAVHRLAVSGASPAQLLADLNRTVAAELPSDRFVTAAALEFDMRRGRLTVANAAHVPAVVRKGQGRGVSVVGRASGVPLGIMNDTKYRNEHHQLDHGDVVVLMTDGVLEAIEPDLLTMSTLIRMLAEPSDGAGDVHRLLLRRLNECTAGALVDDMTLVALEAVQPQRWDDARYWARAS
jgi:serine phosphatase RsbU (regulator of sigma subunit)